jgi:hypothetical protein
MLPWSTTPISPKSGARATNCIPSTAKPENTILSRPARKVPSAKPSLPFRLALETITCCRNPINFDRVFGNHSVSALVLGELQNNSGQDFFGRRQDFQSDLIDQLFAGSNENKDANGGEYRENRLGLIGRLSYDFKAKYFLESSFRYDGSSRFAPGNEWGFFPSVSVGWRISEESFFDGATRGGPEPEIPRLLMAPQATMVPPPTSGYPVLSTAAFSPSTRRLFLRSTTPALANEDLTWETITTYDVGLDASFLRNSLTLSFDYFFRSGGCSGLCLR